MFIWLYLSVILPTSNTCQTMEFMLFLNLHSRATPSGILLPQLIKPTIQQTRYTESMLFQRWPNVFDAGPTLKHYCLNVSCLLGLARGLAYALGEVTVAIGCANLRRFNAYPSSDQFPHVGSDNLPATGVFYLNSPA